MSTLAQQGKAHLLWRDAFFRATGEVPSNNKLLIEVISRSKNPQKTVKIEGKKKIARKLPKSSTGGAGKVSGNGKTKDKSSDRKTRRKLVNKKKKGDSNKKPSGKGAVKREARKKIIRKVKKEKMPEL